MDMGSLNFDHYNSILNEACSHLRPQTGPSLAILMINVQRGERIRQRGGKCADLLFQIQNCLCSSI